MRVRAVNVRAKRHGLVRRIHDFAQHLAEARDERLAGAAILVINCLDSLVRHSLAALIACFPP